jgi:hypothetical protein
MQLQPDTLRLIEIVAATLRDQLGEEYDEATFLDTLDGETDAMDIADRLIADIQGDEALSAAAKAQARALHDRASRIADRATAHRAALCALLKAMGEKKLERPAATVSVRPGNVSAHITDPEAIPTQLCKVVKQPDKAAIKAHLVAGEKVPGAELIRGNDILTVRVA